MTEKTPHKTGIPPLPEQLKIHLTDSLARYGDPHPEDVMAEQAAILDRVFRYTVERSVHYSNSVDIHKVTAALKAQNQYRYTIKTLKTLRDLEAAERAARRSRP